MIQENETRGHPSIESRLAASNTFEELLETAYFEISQLLQEPVGIVCGPITSGGLGSMDAKLAHYEGWINKLKSEGENKSSQIPYEKPMQRIKKTPYYDPTWNHILETFYGSLFKSSLNKT